MRAERVVAALLFCKHDSGRAERSHPQRKVFPSFDAHRVQVDGDFGQGPRVRQGGQAAKQLSCGGTAESSCG